MINLVMIVIFTGEIQAQPITELFDFMNQRDEVEWTDLNENDIVLNGRDEDLNVVRQRVDNVPTGIPRFGSYETDALYVRARTETGRQTYGIAGRQVIRLPEKGYLQFQGSAELLTGKNSKMEVGMQVETRKSENGEWIPVKMFTGTRHKRDTSEREFVTFVCNLSEWKGQEVRISLVQRVTPSYLRVNGIDRIEPQEIAVQWLGAEIIHCPIRVTFGEEEKVNVFTIMKNKLSSKPASAKSEDVTIEIDFPGSQELVLEGATSGAHGHMKNPSDAPFAVVHVPAAGGYAARDLSYFTCILDDNTHSGQCDEGTYGACARVIDFSQSSGNDMYSATVHEITGAVVLDGNGKAVAALSPSGDASRDFDDHYCSITAATSAVLSNDEKVIHAFYACEDHFQFENVGASSEHNYWLYQRATPFYASIGYARSTPSSNDFGRSFTKMSHWIEEQAIYPILTASYSEEEILMPTGSIRYDQPEFCEYYGALTGGGYIEDASPSEGWGCDSPSVFELGDYYYLLYHEYSIKAGYVHPIKAKCMIGLASATKIKVNDADFASKENPWRKFKESIPNQWNDPANFTEPGVGGEFSSVWNAKVVNGLRTDQPADNSQWRAFPKVSYNTRLAQSGNLNRPYVMMTHGNLGIYIHTGSSLAEWDMGMLIAEWSAYNLYPTLIGDTGSDTFTTNNNKLYYFKLNEGNTGVVYRRTMCVDFDK
ncbi:MAG: hypothetical protein C4527_08635 [Candidatus Omnitrophota bacterium]|jgi:hypothetical protein|nr:MAG: hypothetical protein C4527_08635 [Candidatus Omnitrophota bacterium]